MSNLPKSAGNLEQVSADVMADGMTLQPFSVPQGSF
jgi:hypothetical protein